MPVENSHYVVVSLTNSSTAPREFAIVDAASATIEDEKVTFIHENQQITGNLCNFGTQAECRKYANKFGIISFTVAKSRGKKGGTEKSQFDKDINFKPSTNKVIKVVLHMIIVFKIEIFYLINSYSQINLVRKLQLHQL